MIMEPEADLAQPKPPHHWFWGHLKLMGDIMSELPEASHYQNVVTTIANKYDLPNVFYLDLWPASSPQIIVLDPDVASYVAITNNHPKHKEEAQSVPLNCNMPKQILTSCVG